MNYKIALSVFVISMFLVSTAFVLAKPDLTFRAVDVNPSKEHASVNIPANAIEVSPDIFSLGATTDIDGKIVEGFMIIDRKKENAKPPWAGGNKNSGNKCYEFLSNGAKWKNNESWIVNTSNNQGLNDSFIFDNLASNIFKWENASSANILGDGNTTISTLVADTQSPDGANEVYFGSISENGVIAVTIVWGVFYGPPSQRELVEWDQIYDQVDFNWSSTGEANKMDFENIATHELGHSIGMGHPSSECIEETMYAYADFGETKKRTLNTGDIEGISELY